MIIDCHTHILGAGAEPGSRIFMKEMCLSYFQSVGLLPKYRAVTDKDWESLDYLFGPMPPDQSITDHEAVGIDKIVILGVAPSEYTHYQIRGTYDAWGITGVPGPPSLDKVNDYIAALVRMNPGKFIGFASVNPRYRGVKWALAELERAIAELGLVGLKLYPAYDHYSPVDRQLAWPIWEKAQEMDIPVMIHQATSPVTDARMDYGRPYLLDEVARHFRSLRLLVCHAGFPWTDECICLVEKHPNLYLDLSFFNAVSTREEMLRFLLKCQRWGLPLSRVCWGTDYPCFESLDTLLPKFTTMNEEAKTLGLPPINDEDMRAMLADNFLRFVSQAG